MPTREPEQHCLQGSLNKVAWCAEQGGLHSIANKVACAALPTRSPEQYCLQGSLCKVALAEDAECKEVSGPCNYRLLLLLLLLLLLMLLFLLLLLPAGGRDPPILYIQTPDPPP